MIKIVISGYGKMGHMVEQAAFQKGVQIASISEDICAVNPNTAAECVCIDFTTPDAFRQNYPKLASMFKAVVVGTTGWYDIKDEVFDAFRRSGSTLIWASNFSLGVNAFFAALQKACEVLAKGEYSASVEEIHHVLKLDAPSGTAKSMAGIIHDALGCEVPIESKRIGEVPGTHIARFESSVDSLTFTHEAFSRKGFALGAVEAALMSESLESGIYEFKDLILKEI